MERVQGQADRPAVVGDSTPAEAGREVRAVRARTDEDHRTAAVALTSRRSHLTNWAVDLQSVKAVSTASCSAGRTRWIASFSRVGFTRLVKNTT